MSGLKFSMSQMWGFSQANSDLTLPQWNSLQPTVLCLRLVVQRWLLSGEKLNLKLGGILKKYGIIWEFFQNGGPPFAPFWKHLFIPNNPVFFHAPLQFHNYNYTITYCDVPRHRTCTTSMTHLTKPLLQTPIHDDKILHKMYRGYSTSISNKVPLISTRKIHNNICIYEFSNLVFEDGNIANRKPG